MKTFDKSDIDGYVRSMEKILSKFDTYITVQFSNMYLCRGKFSCKGCMFYNEDDECEDSECGLLVPRDKIDYIAYDFCDGVRYKDYFRAVCYYELFKIEVEVLSNDTK